MSLQKSRIDCAVSAFVFDNWPYLSGCPALLKFMPFPFIFRHCRLVDVQEGKKEAYSCCWGSMGCSFLSHIFRVGRARHSYWLQMESVDPTHRGGGERTLAFSLSTHFVSNFSHNQKKRLILSFSLKKSGHECASLIGYHVCCALYRLSRWCSEDCGAGLQAQCVCDTVWRWALNPENNSYNLLNWPLPFFFCPNTTE